MAQSNNAEKNDGPGSAGPQEAEPRRRLRGFAAMDAERRRRISSVGGKAAHAKGTGHEFTSEEAREAGRKGGRARAARGAQTLSEARIPDVLPFPNPKSG